MEQPSGAHVVHSRGEVAGSGCDMESEQKEELSPQDGLSPQDELLEALQKKDVDAFRDLLRSGRVDPRHRYGKPHYGTCLEIAARRSFGKDFVKELLSHVKPNVNVIVPEPIHHAAKRGHSDVLGELLADKRTKANAHDSEGRTALHYACMHVTASKLRGYESCVKLIMGRFSPADINRTDSHGYSAIHAAARYKPKKPSIKESTTDGDASPAPSPAVEEEDTWEARKQIIKVILDLGRDVLDLDSVRALGRTAREDLLQRFPELEKRLPAGADLQRADPHSALANALRDGRIGVFRSLLQETDPDGNPTLDPNHWFGAPLHATCLEMACKKRDAEAFVDALLTAGADPNTANKLDEKFPIHVACEKGHHKQLKALFEGSEATDPNVRDKLGNTALHYIIEKWSTVANEKRICLDFLIERENIDVNKKNKAGFSALMLAVDYKNKYAIKLILSKKYEELDLTVSFRGKELGEVIIETFPDLRNDVTKSEGSQYKDKSNEWFDLLHTTREDEFVEKLRTTPLHNLSKNNKQFTLLQRAARYGMQKAVKILLEKGADPNDTFKGNLSPPGVLATFHRHKSVMEIFLKHPDFNVDAVDAKGNSALHYAARNGRDLDIVVQLLRRGADTMITNKLGKTPLGKDQVQSLLDQCVHPNEKGPLDEDYELILDYRLLAPGREEVSLDSDTAQYQSVPGDENHISVEKGVENVDLESEMSFLHMMSKDDEVMSLLDHPVARSFIELKWSRVKPIAYFNLGVYVAFVVFLNMFIINGKSLIDQQSGQQTNTTQELVNGTSVNDETQIFSSISFSIVLAWFSLVVSLILWLMLCFREVIQFAFDQRKYIGSVENYLDWSILLFSIVALGMPVLQPQNSLLSTINVITIMLSCAELLVLLGRLSHFAKYIEMLKVVLHGYFLPLVSYCVIIIAFGLSFHTLFHESKVIQNETLNEYVPTELENSTSDFNIWYMSIIKSLVMMTGELDFESYPDRSALSVVLFVMFVLLVTVVLLNLLIGLAVNDTHKIEDIAQQLRLKTRVELILFTESILVNMHNSRWRILRKVSSLLLREKLQGAILFPWGKLEGRKAWVKPNQSPELVLAEEEGPGTGRQVERVLLDRATKIISRRSGEEAAEASAVSLTDVDAKLDRVLHLLAGRGAAEERAQLQRSDTSGNGVSAPDDSCGADARLSSSVFFPEGEDV